MFTLSRQTVSDPHFCIPKIFFIKSFESTQKISTRWFRSGFDWFRIQEGLNWSQKWLIQILPFLNNWILSRDSGIRIPIGSEFCNSLVPVQLNIRIRIQWIRIRNTFVSYRFVIISLMWVHNPSPPPPPPPIPPPALEVPRQKKTNPQQLLAPNHSPAICRICMIKCRCIILMRLSIHRLYLWSDLLASLAIIYLQSFFLLPLLVLPILTLLHFVNFFNRGRSIFLLEEFFRKYWPKLKSMMWP
jgi:hypothetical protein